jgi:hypothetical protein
MRRVKVLLLAGVLADSLPARAQDPGSASGRPAPRSVIPPPRHQTDTSSTDEPAGGGPFVTLALGTSNSLGISGAAGFVVPVVYGPLELGQGGLGVHAAGGVGLFGTKADLGVEWGGYTMLDGKPWTRTGHVGVGVMGARLSASWLRQWATLSGNPQTPRNMLGAELALSLLGTVQVGYYRSLSDGEALVSLGLGVGL